MPEATSSSEDVDFSILIPAFNEEASIEAVLDELRDELSKWDDVWEIIVIDDGSSDDTAARAGSATFVLKNPVNAGYGASLKRGIRFARGRLLCMMDADSTYSSSDISRMKTYAVDYDQVCGVRNCEAGTYPLLRSPAKWCIRKLGEWVSGCTIPDLNSGLRICKADLARTYSWALPNGFSASSSLTLAFLCNGNSIKFVPIEYRHRIGISKFHPIHDSLRFILTIIRVIMYFNPLRIFMPIAAIVFVIGITKSIHDTVRYPTGVNDTDVLILASSVLLAVLGLLADLIVSVAKRI